MGRRLSLPFSSTTDGQWGPVVVSDGRVVGCTCTKLVDDGGGIDVP